MTWLVTFRGKDGVQRQETFDADSRGELFKSLEARGIAAIRVAEAKDGQARPRRHTSGRAGKRPSRLVVAAAGLIVVAIAGGVALWLAAHEDDARPCVEEPAGPKAARPKPKPHEPKMEVEADTSPPQGPTWPEKSPHPDGEWRHGEGPRSIAVTNGCLVTYPHCPGVQMVLPHPAFAAPFETLLDNEIARLLSTKPGDDFIDVPLPRNFDDKFAEAILVPIEIKDDDTPEKAELKRQVKEARRILVDAVKRGESPRQLLEDEARSLRRLMQTRDNYQRIISEQIQGGASDQDINDTVNAANKMLEREGIEGKVVLPWKTKLRLERGKTEGKILD